jgi:hypothetical protein
MKLTPTKAAPGVANRAAVAEAERTCRRALRARQEALLDAAVAETFPASDPVAVVRLL